MEPANAPHRRPRLLLLSIVAAGAIVPLLWLLERLSGPCGDGLCLFGPGLMIIALCSVAAIALAAIGYRRGEKPG